MHYSKEELRYWTNTKHGKIKLTRVSRSAIQIHKGKQFIGSVSPDELYKMADRLKNEGI